MNIFQTLCHFFTVLLIGLSLTLNPVDVAANYEYFIDSESLVDELNETFPSVIPPDIQEQYGQLAPESSFLNYPESTIAITGLAVASVGGAGALLGVVGFSGASGVAAAAAGFTSGDAALAVHVIIVAGMTVYTTAASNADKAIIAAALAASLAVASVSIMANATGNLLYDFYYNHIEYHFTLKDKENRITHGSCLIYFGDVSEHGLEYERDVCHIKDIPSQEQIYAGQEEYRLVKIPQTEDGKVRVGGWTHLDDWIQGQTKVVDTGFIPRRW